MKRFVLALLFLVACAGMATAADRVVREFTLPSYDGVYFRPRISGDWVIVALNSDPNNNGTTKAILLLNVATNKTYTVWPGKGGWPEINGNFAAWSGKLEGMQTFRSLRGPDNGPVMPSNLVMLDLTTWRYYCPRMQMNVSSGEVVLSGHCAAFLSGKSVCLVDMSTGATKIISSDYSAKWTVEMGGDLVVWKDRDKGQIVAYRISTGETTVVADGLANNAGLPKTDGTTVIWEDGGIWSCDITTKSRIKTKLADGYYAAIDGGILVYMMRSAVYGKDLATGEVFRISKGAADQGPSISGNRVVWAKDGKVYCAELAPKNGQVKK